MILSYTKSIVSNLSDETVKSYFFSFNRKKIIFNIIKRKYSHDVIDLKVTNIIFEFENIVIPSESKYFSLSEKEKYFFCVHHYINFIKKKFSLEQNQVTSKQISETAV